MKMDFAIILKDLDGKPMTNAGQDATLRSVAIAALTAVFNDETHLSGEEKFARYELARKIHSATPEEEFSVEEIALVKKLIGKGFPPLVIGPAFLILDKK